MCVLSYKIHTKRLSESNSGIDTEEMRTEALLLRLCEDDDSQTGAIDEAAPREAAGADETPTAVVRGGGERWLTE